MAANKYLDLTGLTTYDGKIKEFTGLNLAAKFSTSSTYNVGAYVTHNGKLYKCTTAVSTAGQWDSNKWTAVKVMEEAATPYGTQSPNQVLAGPSSGSSSAIPTFRALVAADIPSLTSAKISDIQNTYSGTDGKAISGKGVKAALETLDVSDLVQDSSGSMASKTLKTLSETDGKITATFQDIQIAESQVTNLTTDLGNKQPLDADLTAIAGLSGTGFLKRTGSNTWSLDSLTGAMTFVGVSTTDPSASGGATVAGHTTWKKGEVVIYKRSGESGYEEYVATADDNASWELLGDADSYALKTTSVSAGVGLTGGGDLSTNRTIKANLVNEAKSTNAASYTAGGASNFYAVQIDKNDKLGVYVPWSDNDHYPTTFTWTGGTSAGPTGSLTGNSGFTAVSFGAIPSASTIASGVVTTGAQQFAGIKSFQSAIIAPGITGAASTGSAGLAFSGESYANATLSGGGTMKLSSSLGNVILESGTAFKAYYYKGSAPSTMVAGNEIATIGDIPSISLTEASSGSGSTAKTTTTWSLGSTTVEFETITQSEIDALFA